MHTYKSSLYQLIIFILAFLMIASVEAAIPLWTIIPAPGNNPSQTVPFNGSINIQYIVQNQSNSAKTLVIKPTAGLTQAAPCQLARMGQAGSSCTLSLNIAGSAMPEDGIHAGPVLCSVNPDGSPNINQCYQPSAANSLNITRGPSITVTPTTLIFETGTSATVTVTNAISSPEPALNVLATIPGGSTISVQSTTCGASLAVGASCTITFTSNGVEGPTAVSVGGDNTNQVTVNITVAAQPIISITSPVQQNRIVAVAGAALSLEITNDNASLVNANAITVSDKVACPDLVVDDSDCNSVAPGATCTLELTSPTPYVPCTITISGNNTSNSPQTLIAFSYFGGLVFDVNGAVSKVVLNADETSPWTGSTAVIPFADSNDDGFGNTDAIVFDASCSGDANNCAAQRCRNIAPDLYLPAIDEISGIRNELCSNNAIPCNFGGFSAGIYWSSTQNGGLEALNINFPLGIVGSSSKTDPLRFRCVREIIN